MPLSVSPAAHGAGVCHATEILAIYFAGNRDLFRGLGHGMPAGPPSRPGDGGRRPRPRPTAGRGVDPAGQEQYAERVQNRIDAVAGEPAAQLASLLKIGGQIISYTARARQPLSIPVVDLIFRGLSVHGYWLNLWLQRTPRDTVAQTYHELATLVADGTLTAPIEATYALADYREAIAHAARNDRNGKVLFALR